MKLMMQLVAVKNWKVFRCLRSAPAKNPPTSNACQRLFSQAKLILTPQRALSWLLHRAMKRPEWRGAVQLSIVFPDH
ncbi:hypothetical protein PC119_g24095 [Phytophthora cactorum]|nr:hypothetical protein PC119_g24095 [Phytophthora cactorum]